MASNTKSRTIAVTLGFITLWILLFSLTYSPEPTATYRYPVAEVNGNVAGDPYETGRLFTRWQSEGGMKDSLENFMAIPWGASLVLLDNVENSDRVKLVYIGELGPDYPLLYTEEVVAQPNKQRLGYSYHEWRLEGSRLVLHSSKAWYNEWLRLFFTGLFSLCLWLIIYVLAMRDSRMRAEKS